MVLKEAEPGGDSPTGNSGRHLDMSLPRRNGEDLPGLMKAERRHPPTLASLLMMRGLAPFAI